MYIENLLTKQLNKNQYHKIVYNLPPEQFYGNKQYLKLPIDST